MCKQKEWEVNNKIEKAKGRSDQVNSQKKQIGTVQENKRKMLIKREVNKGVDLQLKKL